MFSNNLCIDKNKWQNDSRMVNRRTQIFFYTLIACWHRQVTTKISPIRNSIHHREWFPQTNYILTGMRHTRLVSLLLISWLKHSKRLAKFMITRVCNLWTFPNLISLTQRMLRYYTHAWCKSPKPPSLYRTFGQSSWLHFQTFKSILHPIKLFLFLLLFKLTYYFQFISLVYIVCLQETFSVAPAAKDWQNFCIGTLNAGIRNMCQCFIERNKLILELNA